MNNLSVLLLGSPEVLIGNRPLAIKRRAPRALLYFLAATGRMSGRDELLALFWGNETEVNARRRLRETLSRLKKSLPDPDLIVTNNDLIGLRTESVYIDLLAFQSLLEQAGQASWQIPPEEPLPDKYHRLLHEAASLWRSPKFLSGIQLLNSPDFERWIANCSNQAERQYLRVLSRLADHAYATNNLEQALKYVLTGLQIDEYEEDLHYRYLRTLIAAGRRIDARDHYNQLEALYRTELSTRLSPKLADLYQEIHTAQPSASTKNSPLLWNIHPAMQAPFIGRRQEIENLHHAYQRGGGLIILGESGQGKTRLLQEFISQLNPAPRILLSSCKPAENNLTFQPIIEVLRHNIFPDEWKSLSPAWASQLSLLLPEIIALRPDLGDKQIESISGLSQSRARSQVFEAIRQVFTMVAQRQRLVFCLDDTQWADETTLEALAYLLERPPFNDQALLLMAARSERENRALDQLLLTLSGSSRIHLIRIPQLAHAEIQSLATTILGQSLPVNLISQLERETGGNPLFILEILRAILERDDLAGLEASEQLPLTDSLQQLIHSRLAQLSMNSRRVLEIAAVTGVEFDLEIITGVGDFSHQELEAAIDDLIQQLLIEPVSVLPGRIRYQFIHSKIRDVLLQEISPLNFRALEAKIAFALESQETSQPAILARHFEFAGKAALAFKYWLQAGQRARQLYSNSDATQAFQHAERMIHLSSEITDDAIHALYAEWTDLAFVLEDDATIRRINNELLSIGEIQDNKFLIGTALLGLSDSCMVNNRFDDGLTYATRAVKYLENSDNLFAWINALIHKGLFELMLGRLDTSIQEFQEALAVGIDSDDTRVLMARANAHYQIAIAHTLSGWPAGGLNHASIALGDTSLLGYQHGRITAYSALALARYFLGEYRLACQESQVGIELAERLQAWRMLGYLHSYHAMAELAIGNIDATIHHAQMGIQLGQEYGHTEITATSLRLMGDIFYWLQDIPNAIKYYRKAVQVSKDQFLAPDHQMRLGLSLILYGQQQSGQELLTKAFETSKQTGLGMVTILSQLSQSLAYIVRQDWDSAHNLTTHVYHEALRRSMPSIRLSAVQLLGEIAENTGDTDTAVSDYKKIIMEAASLQYVWIEIAAQKRLADLYIQSGISVDDIRRRISDLLANLDHQSQHPLVRDSFRAYALAHQI